MTIGDVFDGLIAAVGVVVPTALGLVKWAKVKFETCESERAELRSIVTALQISMATAAPEWVRDNTGVIRSVSPEFVRMIGVRLGLHSKDFLGKSLSRIGGLSTDLPATLKELERRAAVHKYAIIMNVTFAPNLYVSIITMCINGVDSDPMYRAIFLPMDTVTPDAHLLTSDVVHKDR